MEQRLAQLEENQYFQEKHLKELDEALQAQQKYIDMLEKKLAHTEERLLNILAQSSEGYVQTLPPHFAKY